MKSPAPRKWLGMSQGRTLQGCPREVSWLWFGSSTACTQVLPEQQTAAGSSYWLMCIQSERPSYPKTKWCHSMSCSEKGHDRSCLSSPWGSPRTAQQGSLGFTQHSRDHRASSQMNSENTHPPEDNLCMDSVLIQSHHENSQMAFALGCGHSSSSSTVL